MLLVAHVIATQSHSRFVTDESMDFPADWSPIQARPGVRGSSKGQQDGGRTILVHSLAVSPDHQGRGLGTVILKSYVQRMESSGIADRIALIAHDRLIPFYERLGFSNMGASACTFGGGGWYNMVSCGPLLTYCIWNRDILMMMMTT